MFQEADVQLLFRLDLPLMVKARCRKRVRERSRLLDCDVHMHDVPRQLQTVKSHHSKKWVLQNGIC